MDFDDDPLLNDSNVMLVALRTATQAPTTPDACLARLNRIIRRAGATEAGSPAELHKLVKRAFHYLCMAGLLDPDQDGVCTITKRGRDVLRDHPTGVDFSVLEAFPEFRSYLRHPWPDRDEEGEFGPGVEPKMAYDQGFAAFKLGQPLTDNPHDSDTVNHLEWENGWFEARKENSRP